MANSVHSAVNILTAAIMLGFSGGFAFAQEAPEGPILEIIVEAPRSIPLPRQRSSFTGAPIVVTTVQIPVRYDDLDLTKPADRTRFMTRIERVAEDACKELDWLHPLAPDQDCVRKTAAKAAVAANATIAAAAAGP